MQILRADTLVKVVIGPIVDITDGYTPINSLLLSTADAAEIMKHDASSVTDISANTFSQISGATGFYNLTLSASQLDTEGMLTVCIADTSLCYPYRHEFMVVNANTFDSFYAASTTDYLQVDAYQIASNATSATNLKYQYDGSTGLNGDTFPSTQAQVGNLAVGSAAISVPAESQLLTTGTQVNDYTATVTLDGVYHQVSDSGGAFELYYQFDVGGNGIAVDVAMVGRLYGANDTIGVYAYDWTLSSWAQIGSMTGSNGTTDALVSFNLLARYTGTGSNLGKVRVRGYAASGLTSATLYMDQVYVTYSVVAQSAGYSQGAVWINTVSGNAGTEPYVNGVADNPVDTLADAITIAGNLNLTEYSISNNSTITFASTLQSQVFRGQGWTLNLGTQNIDDSFIIGATDVNGAFTITSNEPHFLECEIFNITAQQSHFKNCGLNGTITMNGTGTYTFQHCYSQVAGGGTPILDFGSGIGSTDVNFRHYSGGIQLENFNASSTDQITIEGNGQLIIAASCVAGTIYVRGNFKVTDNSGGAVTVSYDDNSMNITTIATDLANGGRTDLLIDSIISLLDDPRAEPTQGTPAANEDAMTKLDYVYKFLRNKVTSNATTINIYNDDESTIDHKATHDDDGITYTRGEFTTGP